MANNQNIPGTFPQGYIQPIAQSRSQKTLMASDITRLIETARKKNVYFQAAKPNKPLVLGGALAYVRKNPVSDQDPFVYFPDYRIAGKVSDIYNLLATAGFRDIQVGELYHLTGGIAGNTQAIVQLNPQTILNNSFNPLNPAHAQLLKALSEKARINNTSSTSQYKLSDYIAIGEYIKINMPSLVASGVPSAPMPRQTKTKPGPEGKMMEKIQDFETAMGTALNGMNPERILNVSNFNPSNLTGVRKTAPTTTSRSSLIRPKLLINNRYIDVPIVSNVAGVQNFNNYVDTIVAKSRYHDYVPMIKNAFNQIITSQQPTGIPQYVQVPQPYLQGGITSPMVAQAPNTYQAPIYPTVSQLNQLPTLNVAKPDLGQSSNYPNLMLPTTMPAASLNLPINSPNNQSPKIKQTSLPSIMSPTSSRAMSPTAQSPINLGSEVGSPRSGRSSPRQFASPPPMTSSRTSTQLPTLPGLPSLSQGGVSLPSLPSLPSLSQSPQGGVTLPNLPALKGLPPMV